jgi:enoyl reductase-like protein|tara:strand:- start:271 stop:705 length:435 start_codon:yes stop_codon:yes gene_type:complete
MAITFVNIWETKILDTIRTFLNAEFAGSIPVYTGNFKDMGNQSIRLNPVGSNLVERMTTAELREYIVDVSYTFKEKMIKKDTWEHILRQVSHIEALFFQNQKNTFYNGRFETTRINEKEEAEEAIDGLVVIRWEWRGLYLGNVS